MPTLPIEDMRRIADEVLGGVDWKDDGRGYCTCPGQALHTNPNGRRDCRVTLLPGGRSEAPTVHCFHSGCSAAIEEANHRLRSAIGKAKWALEHPSARSGAAAKDLKRGAARPSGPKAQSSGMSGSGSAGREPTGKSGGDARTLRTPFLNSVPAEEGRIDAARTLRTDFLHKFRIRAQAHTHTQEGATSKNTSEVSGPVRPPDPPPAPPPEQKKEAPAAPSAPASVGLPDPESITWRPARLERGGDFRTKFTRFVDDRGQVHHAQVVEADGVRQIRIGRQICQLGGESV
jgi:hypothetical protein